MSVHRADSGKWLVRYRDAAVRRLLSQDQADRAADRAYREVTERNGPRLPIVPSEFFSARWMVGDSQSKAKDEA